MPISNQHNNITMIEAIQQIKEGKNFTTVDGCKAFLTKVAAFLDLEIDPTLDNAPKIIADYAWQMKNMSGSLVTCLAAATKHKKQRIMEETIKINAEENKKDKKDRMGANVIKAIVEGRCADAIATEEMAQRLDRRMSHIMDLSRSALSLYKTELEKGI
jgi:hypothetical protein